MILSLGVENIAYSDPEAKGATTTGEVAEILEDKYHVMETFYELYRQSILSGLVRGMIAQVQSISAGAPPPRAVLPGVMSNIGAMFRDYLNRDEWQSVTGHRIEAAHEGVSHRFKNKTTGSARPAFIDTGLYRRSFRAQVKK